MRDIKGAFAESFNNLKSKSKGFSLERLKAYLPKEKPRINVGLDIGSFSIKAAALRIEKDKSELVDFSVRQREKESVADSVNEVLKELKADDNKIINISVAGQGVIVRCVQLPNMSISDAKKAVGFEAEKHIPFALDEVFLDCFLLKEMPQENKMLVLVAAAKKDLINQRLDILKKIDVVPNIIDVDSLALTNILNRGEFKAVSPQIETGVGEPKKVVALFNFGASFSSLCIIEDGLPRFMRDIFVGGNDLTKRISNIFGLSIIEAERVKCNPSADWEKVIDACGSLLSNLINEIRRSFDYYESEANAQIGSLYLSGGGSNLKGISEIFKNDLNIETRTLDPFIGLNIIDSLDVETLKSQAHSLGVAIGLALRIR